MRSMRKGFCGEDAVGRLHPPTPWVLKDARCERNSETSEMLERSDRCGDGTVGSCGAGVRGRGEVALAGGACAGRGGGLDACGSADRGSVGLGGACRDDAASRWRTVGGGGC